MKEKKELKIVYMGTPDFAVEPLRRLVEGGYHIVGVITMPDKPAGRGHKLQFSAVKKYALECALPILQPTKLKEESFIEALRTWQADLQIVVAFRMLPEVVWNMPPMGTFNLHASLLPQYRGAAPINWAVINGDKETGITTFFLEHQIDTGNIIQQEKIAIEETDDVGIVHDKLMNLGAELVLKTVDALLAGTVKAIPQQQLADAVTLRPAPKIFKETCRINWAQSTTHVYDFLRGLSPHPVAWTLLEQGEESLVFKIYQTQKMRADELLSIDTIAAKFDPIAIEKAVPGTIVCDEKKYLCIATSDGWIRVQSLQVPGKRRMDVEDYLRGYRGDPLETARFC